MESYPVTKTTYGAKGKPIKTQITMQRNCRTCDGTGGKR